jgi:hypothetical protein
MLSLGQAVNITYPVYGATNSSWNYDQGGSDWTYEWCTMKEYVQAPITMTNVGANSTGNFTWYVTYPWSLNGYAFLPNYESGSSTWYGIEQYVYQIFGEFGGIYLSEPARNNATNHVVYYETTNLRFHYPAEHVLNGTRYDLEMQIFGSDRFGRSLGCFSNNSAVSILFKIDDTVDANPFFSWQADADGTKPITLDLSPLLDKVAGATKSVSGYMGSDSMPGCDYGTCWYIMNQPLTIKSSQVDFFKVKDLASNARTVDLTGSSAWTQSFYNYGLFAPLN